MCVPIKSTRLFYMTPPYTDSALFIYTIFFTGRAAGSLGAHHECFVRVAAPNATEAARQFKANAASGYGYEYGPGYFLVSRYPFKAETIGTFIVRTLRKFGFEDGRMAHLVPLMERHAKRRPNSVVSLIFCNAYPFHVA